MFIRAVPVVSVPDVAGVARPWCGSSCDPGGMVASQL